MMLNKVIRCVARFPSEKRVILPLEPQRLNNNRIIVISNGHEISYNNLLFILHNRFKSYNHITDLH